MKSLMIIIPIIFLIFSCSGISTDAKWDDAGLYKIVSINSEVVNDTTIVTLNDNSYIYYDEYMMWKNGYLIYTNKELLDNVEILKILAVQDGRDYAMEGIYFPEHIKGTINAFVSNSIFDSISKYVLKNFDPTEYANFRSAHLYLNEEEKNYNGQVNNLFEDFSFCTSDDCFAYQRIKLIGEMLQEVKLRSYWHKEKRIDANELITKLNHIISLKGFDKIKQ